MDPSALLTAARALALTALARGGSVDVEIKTGSMSPVLRPGDTVVVSGMAPHAVRPGMIAVWEDARQSPRCLVVHRVIAVTGPAEDRAFVTRGDASRYPDPEPLPGGALIGVVTAVRRGRSRTMPVRGLRGRWVLNALYLAARLRVAVVPWLRDVPRAVLSAGHVLLGGRVFPVHRAHPLRTSAALLSVHAWQDRCALAASVLSRHGIIRERIGDISFSGGLSEESLQCARAGARVEPVAPYAHAPASTYGMVLLVDELAYVPGPRGRRALLSAARALLVPGGRICILLSAPFNRESGPGGRSIRGLLRSRWAVRSVPGGAGARVLTEGQVREDMAAADLTLEHCERYRGAVCFIGRSDARGLLQGKAEKDIINTGSGTN